MPDLPGHGETLQWVPLLHTLKPNDGAVRNRKRLGRGHGLGLAQDRRQGPEGPEGAHRHHTAFFPKPGFEGGQTAMSRRIPKRGFTKSSLQEGIFAVNLGDPLGPVRLLGELTIRRRRTVAWSWAFGGVRQDPR